MSASNQRDPDFDGPTPKPRLGPGCTFIELFVVIGIIGVLIAFFLPAVRSARPAAYRAQCTNNLKQIALALRNYENDHGALPPAYTIDAAGRPLHGWRTLILPYLEQGPLYDSIDLSKPWDDPANARALETSLLVYHCPRSDKPPNTTTYMANVGRDRCFDPTQPRKLAEITDDHASTILVIDAGEENAVPWMAPVDSDRMLIVGIDSTAKLHHTGGTNAAFVDGQVHFLKAETPARARRALMSIAGGDDQDAKIW